MAAQPVPVLCSASPCRITAHLAPPALRISAAARPLVLPGGYCGAHGGPSPRRSVGRAPVPVPFAAKRGGEVASEDGAGSRALLQAALWGAESAYILWLFLLPYAPGDPVWAISQATISDLISLSLNFFFILPLLNSAGVHLLESPVLHPMAEGLFNFVIAWTLLFAPLLFTDSRRDRYKGSVDVLWGFQMFLANSFLIPYMAIRLNDPDADRWQFAQSYVLSERLAYAFVWDILLYSVFQPWLIGDNIQNVKADATEFVNVARFVPVIGLVAYLFCLEEED